VENAAPHGELADELASHLEFLRRMARALVRDEQVAEDVVQETLVAALVRRPTPEIGLRLWLGSVLKRRVLLHFRTEQRRVAREVLLERDAKYSPAGVAADEAERALLLLERSAALGREVAALEEPYRTVVLLRFYEGLQPKDIAQRLQRPVATVNTQLQRGLQQLRTKLDSSYGERRAWVCALLPLALEGPDGWWPSSVKGVAGVSYGALSIAFATLLVVTLGTWRSMSSTGQTNEDRGPGPPSAQPTSLGNGALSTEDELAASSPSPARTALAVPTATTSSVATAGTLRLRVSSRLGPVPGARVVAHSSTDGNYTWHNVSSALTSADGGRIEVTLDGFGVDRDGPADARRVAGIADRTGVVDLPLLDGAQWKLQIEAEGFAPRDLSICVTASLLEQEVELDLGSKVILERGSLPTDLSILAKLHSDFDTRAYEALLPRGQQRVEVKGLTPGIFHVAAFTAGGAELALWSTECLVEADTPIRLDLSLGGVSSLEVEVLGAAPGAPPQFAVVSGPLNERGTATWSRYAAFRGGLARFVALPPGPAAIKVLSAESEIGREWVTLERRSELQRVAVRIARGELRIFHDAGDVEAKRFELARRSERVDSIEGWSAMGKPHASPGGAHYVGLDDGSYRLWVIENGSAQCIEVQIRGEAVELDLRARAGELMNVRVERGPGAEPDGEIKLEFAPRQWLKVAPLGGVLALSRGVHRLRTTSAQGAYITRSVDVPRDEQVVLDAPSAATPIEVRCDSVWSGTTVIVTPHNTQAPPGRSRSLSLYFDRDGSGRINLSPGVYVLTDRTGRKASMTVESGLTVVFVHVP